MPGTILENLSGRKLNVLVAILLVFQVACFLVGLIAPSPANFQNIYATFCYDDNPGLKDEPGRWFTKDCKRKITNLKTDTVGMSSNNIVSFNHCVS